MSERALDDVVGRRFWLGQLPPDEEERIQALAFEDPDTFVFLESIEDDLIDEFLHDELSEDEQRSFESHFMSQPGRGNDLKINRVLQQHFDRIPPDTLPTNGSPIRGWFRSLSIWVQISISVGAAVLLVAFLVWLFYFRKAASQSSPVQAGSGSPVAVPSPQFNVSPSTQPTDSPTRAQNKPKNLAPEEKKGFSPYALLSPSALPRGEGIRELPLAHDIPSMTIELALITPTNFNSYEVVLQNEAGKVLQTWANLKAEHLRSGKALQIDLPTALLKPNEFYVIVVSGINSAEKKDVIGRYPFEAKP